MAGAGGPLRAFDLATRTQKTLFEKNDPRLGKQAYMYFPMLSNGSALLAFGASPNEHDHEKGNYDIFVVEVDPSTLDVLGQPLKYTSAPTPDRYPGRPRRAAPPGPPVRRGALPGPPSGGKAGSRGRVGLRRRHAAGRRPRRAHLREARELRGLRPRQERGDPARPGDRAAGHAAEGPEGRGAPGTADRRHLRRAGRRGAGRREGPARLGANRSPRAGSARTAAAWR